ncbi:hypothetical protein BG015_001735 [Linnemannia schmuckeri]|uniref:Uncharacterized protein n=1 Tax=Linnemannia schmuckeri TaxID=64567 RepID=A0A9P5S637_9FUNG|nr:hypothetical protein BG015_001735 [Linnemannia schmuckeri]
MGFLDLSCMTTDPDGTTFYGLSYANDYSSNNGAKPKYTVLVRSNTNPSFPTDLKWSIVSMFESSKLTGYADAVNGGDYSCAINGQGVFTMFGRYKVPSSSGDNKVPFGIRYDPSGAMDPSFGLKGPGSWMNITVNTGYNWSKDFRRSTLGYVNIGTGSVLTHATISDTNNTITLATMDESTKSLTAAAQWATNATIHGKANQSFSTDLLDMTFFVPINGDGISPRPLLFALLKNGGTMYAFSNGGRGGSEYTYTTYKVNVTDPYGINPNPTHAAQPSKTILSTGDIVGIIVGTLVLAVCTFLLGRRIYRKQDDNKETTEAAADKSQPNQSCDNYKDHPQAQVKSRQHSDPQNNVQKPQENL